MVRALQVFAVLTLISAGVVFVLCVVQQLQGTSEIEWNPRLSNVEKFIQAGGLSEKSNQKMLSPLVREAEAFSLYLNPPQPPKSKEDPIPGRSLKLTISSEETAKSKAEFRLVATCYYRSRPEKSMALVSEPSSELRWLKQGARLGHFVVEKVKRGTIVYRDGNQLREMAVDMKVPVRTKQAKQTMLASNQKGTSPPKPSRPRRTSTTTPKLLHKLGLQRPETRLTVYARDRKGGG